jgi:hypothetical protein
VSLVTPFGSCGPTASRRPFNPFDEKAAPEGAANMLLLSLRLYAPLVLGIMQQCLHAVQEVVEFLGGRRPCGVDSRDAGLLRL